jgi:hypothetical protein
MNPKVINILQEKKPTTNGAAFAFPLYLNRKRLKEAGIELRFYSSPSNLLFDCDVLIITSKFANENHWWFAPKKIEMFKFFEKAKHNVNHLIWADLSDGTGTTHYETLPYVDRYLKGSVLKNRKNYQKFLYGSRYVSDYYHDKFGIEDDDPGEPHLNRHPDDSEIHKIYVSWNSALYNYSYCGCLWRKLNNRVKCLPMIYLKDWTSPEKNRPNLISCRINTKYNRNTISFQRCQVLDNLKGKIQEGRLTLARYFKELKNSRVGISPFGAGEICYRDYETIICGATLMKPDCDHMETWPNLYIKNKTYISFKWDFSDFDYIIDTLPDRQNELIEIAQEAQNLYYNLLFTENWMMIIPRSKDKAFQKIPLNALVFLGSFTVINMN